MIKRTHVRCQLIVDADAGHALVERVHGFHADECPVARSIRDAIAISTELVVAPV